MAMDNPMVILEWIFIIILVCMSGLFSGLNLGLMSLDPIGLQIVMASENEKNRLAAQKIQPIRKHGNWLLCTLLIGNVAVNSALSILLADKTSGSIGFVVSTVTITIFGEIIPQALCSRYALEIGAKTIWIVWPLMWLMAIVAYPIAYILDKALGQELGTVYSNKELQKLVEIHAEMEGTGLTGDTAGMLKGALGLKDALVLNCMTEMKDVFWLNDQSKLSFDVLTEIFKSGHSRIPIFNTSDKFGRITCVGLLYVKDLILLDPDDEMPVTQIMNAFKHKTPPIVWKDDTLQHLLEIFVKTSQHLAFVQDIVTNKHSNTIAADTAHTLDLDNTYEYVGIITLEDVIEHVLQTQLIDEHDNFVDNKHMLRTNRLNRIDWNMLHIFDHRQRVLTTLPPQELQAVYHFLSQTIKPFTPKNRLVSEASIKNLLATSSVIRVVVNQDDQVVNSKFGRRISDQHSSYTDGNNTLTQRDPYKDIEDNGLLLYQRDKATKYFTLLLDGKSEIYAGRQGFRCELTRWSYLCPHALDHCVDGFRYNKPLLEYVPDFTAKIIENSRVLRIKLDDFRACLEGKFDFDSTVPASPMGHNQVIDSINNRGDQFGFGTRGSTENVNNMGQINEYEYEYPNTYHLNERMNNAQANSANEIKNNNNSSHSLHDGVDAIKQMFSHKKHKKNKQNHGNNYNSVPSIPHNATDSDSGDRGHPRNIAQHHSSDNHASLFIATNGNEREPLMHSASDPHIVTHTHTQLPTPRTISDNSAQNHNNAGFGHLSAVNNYQRLNEKNNLSYYCQNNEKEMQTIIEVKIDGDESKYNSEMNTESEKKLKKIQNIIVKNQQTNTSNEGGESDNNIGGGDSQEKHVYKKRTKKRTLSSEKPASVVPSSNEIGGDSQNKDQLHLYTTPNTSNVSAELFNNQKQKQ